MGSWKLNMRDMRAIESVSQIFLVIGENLNGISQELYSVISIVSSMPRSDHIQRDMLHANYYNTNLN